MAQVVERRYRRFRLAAPVVFKWWDNNGTVRNGRGYSRDISGGGIFTRAARDCPPIASVLRYEVLLPQITDTSAAILIKAAGRVMRTQRFPNSGYEGFAVQSSKVMVSSIE